MLVPAAIVSAESEELVAVLTLLTLADLRSRQLPGSELRFSYAHNGQPLPAVDSTSRQCSDPTKLFSNPTLRRDWR